MSSPVFRLPHTLRAVETGDISPIIEANGKSSAGVPQVKRPWLAIGDIQGRDYSTGA